MRRPAIILYLLIAAAATVQSQQYRQLTDVPTIYIETENHQAINSKDTYVNCTFVMVDGQDTLRYEQTQIRGRGNSSWWNSPKKPYRLKFASKHRLLGPDGANARSWTLLANHGDKTMLRNALTCDLGRFMGMKFCPGARFVDLYVNGSYRGTYQISDQVQVHKGRIPISEEDGWLLEVANENSRETPYITTSNIQSWYAQLTYNIKNPDDENYNATKRQAIQQWLNRFERAVMSPDFADPDEGYRAMVDEEDLINWYVGAELTGNIDALYSIYMYKDADEERMHFGPLWDIDLGYDNSSEKSLMQQMEAYLWLWNRPFEQVVQQLWKDPWFAHACSARLNELVSQGLQQYLLDHIDSLRNAIWQSQTRNFRVWPINQQVYSFEKHTYHNTYDEYVADLKTYVNRHIPYLVNAFAKLDREVGINEVASGPSTTTNSYFDLSGRPVAHPTRKGIYIRQGKKMVRK